MTPWTVHSCTYAPQGFGPELKLMYTFVLQKIAYRPLSVAVVGISG